MHVAQETNIPVAAQRSGCSLGDYQPPLKSMATKLDKTLKREIEIDEKTYIITLDPQGLKLTEKGRRKGPELQWKDLVNGGAALAQSLNSSLDDAE